MAKNTQETKIVQNQSKPNEEKGLTGFIFKVAGLTVLGIVFGFYFFMAIFMGIAPQIPARVFDVIGSDTAALMAYEQNYKHNLTPENLYNVVAKSVEMNDKARIMFYVPKLQAMDGYEEFEEKINKASVEAVTADKVAFVYDIDSYLTSIYMNAAYNSGFKDGVELYIYQDNGNERIYSNSVVPYINCLYHDTELDIDEKSSKLNCLQGTVNIDSQEITLIDLAQQRFNKAEEQYGHEETLAGKIFNIYYQIKTNTCMYQMYDMMGEETKAQEFEQKVDELKITYNNLVLSA